MSELALREETILERLGASVTPTSLTLTDPDLPYDGFEELCSFIGSVNRSCAFWTGDLLLAGEKLYGEEFAQAAEAFGLAPQTLANRLSICRHVPPAVRNANLSFSLHAEVAALEPAEQVHWLTEAERHDWTKAELRTHIHGEPIEDAEITVLPPAGMSVEEAARAVWHASTRIVGDAFVVPAGPMLELMKALDG